MSIILGTTAAGELSIDLPVLIESRVCGLTREVEV